MGDGADFSVNNDPRMSVREKRARFEKGASSRVAPQEASCPSSSVGMGFFVSLGKHSFIRLRRFADNLRSAFAPFY